MPFTLPALSFPYAALEPHIDARTMEIHHTKHHQAYINNANAALEPYPSFRDASAETILKDLSAVPEAVRTAVRNNAGGHANHSFFWTILSPSGGGAPSGKLAQAIDEAFGSFDAFKEKFAAAAAGRFGSGWAWLASDPAGKLSVYSTANQDSPLSDGLFPVVGLDVWEHAYYLNYQNRRPDYIKAFWSVLDWKKAGEYYQKAIG